MHRSQASGPGLWTAVVLWRRLASERPDALAYLGLRTASPVPRDALALAATGGTHTAADLLQALREGSALPSGGLGAPRQLAWLALVWAGGAATSGEMQAAAATYLDVLERMDPGQLGPVHHQVAAQTLFLAGRLAELRSLLPTLSGLPEEVRPHLLADLAHPYLPGAHTAPGAQRHAEWEALLSAPFTAGGHAPLAVLPPGTDPTTHLFDRLSPGPGTRPPGSAGGPLVTVVMPCYRPDEGLLTSVHSIRAQTYADLEVILVDDASGPASDAVFEEALALDSRARLVRMERNGGSYLAREAAIAQSRGHFITFQDADDWSHPERIERQVACLGRAPAAMASLSHAVRARDDLTHQWLGYPATRPNASSLLIRREVVARLGPFLPVRRGADSEYAERIEALMGPVVDTGTPLAVTRLRSGSLSRGDFRFQWTVPDRLSFRGSYRAQLRRSRDSGAWLGSPPVPLTFVRGLERTPRVADHLGDAFLADFRADPTDNASPDRPTRWLWERLRHDPAMATGLWHVERPWAVGTRRPEMHAAWFDRIVATDHLQPVTRVEALRVDRLVVLEASTLLLAGAQPCAVACGRVEVCLTPGDLEAGPDGLPLDLLAVGDTIRSWFGLWPVWVVAPHLDDAEQAALREQAQHLRLALAG